MSNGNTKNLMLRIRSAPFANDPEFMADFYDVIGRIVILWSRFESQVDTTQMLCAEIGAHYGSCARVETTFKKKIKLIGRLMASVPPLTPLHPQFEALIPDIVDAAKDRNTVIHSPLGPFNEGERSIKLTNMRYDGDTLKIASYTVTLESLRTLLGVIDSLNTQMLIVSLGVSNIHRGYEGKRTPSATQLSSRAKDGH